MSTHAFLTNRQRKRGKETGVSVGDRNEGGEVVKDRHRDRDRGRGRDGLPVAGEMEESEGGKERGGRASWKGKKTKERGRGRQKVRKMERGRRGRGHVASGSRAGGPPPRPQASCGEGWSLAISGREDARVIAEQHIHGSGHFASPKSQVHDDPGGKGWVAGKPACVLSRMSGAEALEECPVVESAGAVGVWQGRGRRR